jgi:phosphohistidine swiveling domain-containing protein
MVLGVLEATSKIPDGANIGIDGVMGMVRWQQ